MCGFTGILLGEPGASFDQSTLGRMTASLAHRGPDDQVLETAPGAALGFRRLSIIDLDGGRQPFVREDGKLIACTNGEIYNFAELRRELEAKGHTFRTDSDCEVVPALYLEHGAALAERLVGMFAFCLLDLRGPRPKLLLGRDRLGIKPMYYAFTEQGCLFGSEPKALLASELLSRRLRPEALLDYLVQGYVGGEASAWDGVQRLPAGHVLEVEAGEAARPKPYWSLPQSVVEEERGPQEILHWLDRCVADRLISDVPLGAFLSGGIDSTAVVDAMTRAREEPVIACSIGFREKSHDELALARATAERLGLVHHTSILEPDPTLALTDLPWFYDEPHADPSNLPTFLVSRAAREHVTVALSGDGGDEVFAGYRRYVHDLAENRLRRGIGALGRSLARGLGAAYPKLDWAPRPLRAKTFLTNVADDPAHAYWRSVTQMGREDAIELLAPDLAARLTEHDPFEAFARHYERPESSCSLFRAQYADFHTYLPDQILAKVDRASMGVSLEVRVPLLDHRFVERFCVLPAEHKVRGGRGKHAFREALRSRLPDSILDGTKRGFDTPLASWLRGPLSAAVEDSIETLPSDWFRRDECRERLARHRAGVRDHGRLLWSLLVLEQWRRRHGVQGLSA